MNPGAVLSTCKQTTHCAASGQETANLKKERKSSPEEEEKEMKKQRTSEKTGCRTEEKKNEK
ncbi:UNVERIFIED_CONTAM: hypothetical protein FKN15_042633 [Acipenser sinensis]